MKVKSKKDTRRLVKGGIYNVKKLFNDGTSSYLDGTLELEEILGLYNVDDFTCENGEEVPKIFVEYEETRDLNDVQKGDILVCITDSFKLLMNNSKYRVSEVIKAKSKNPFNNRVYYKKKVKFDGINRAYKVNSWNFRILSQSEQREVQLETVLSGKVSVNKEPGFNLEKVNNKEKVLMELISKSIIDTNRNNLSIIDWAIKKVGEKQSLEKSEFNDILEMPLKDILSKIE